MKEIEFKQQQGDLRTLSTVQINETLTEEKMTYMNSRFLQEVCDEIVPWCTKLYIIKEIVN